MTRRYFYPTCVATALSPLVLLDGWYVYGSTQYLSLATFLLFYGSMALLLLAAAALIAIVALAVRSLCFDLSSKYERAVACTAAAFLFVFWLVNSIHITAFVCGAKARISALGGPAFVAILLSEAELLSQDADPSLGGEIPQHRIPEPFRKIGCKYARLIPDRGIVHCGVSGALFPSGWWLVKDETNFRPPSDVHKISPHLYRFEK